MDQNDSNEDHPSLGDIRVNHSVVASIVRLAALEVPGVCGVGAGLVDGLADLIKKESDRGVRINEDADGSYAVEIRLVMAFGTELAKTAYQVQLAVRKQVEAMTGNNVRKVDVTIEGIKQVAEKPAERSDSDEVWPDLSHHD